MQMMIAGRPEPQEKQHLTHKRMERWIRLQQFVYGLPDDYVYAVCTTENGGRAESHALVTIGWMTWFGRGRGTDRQHSLALALLDTSEALSANSTKVFLHGLSRWLTRGFQALRPIPTERGSGQEKEAGPQPTRLAG